MKEGGYNFAVFILIVMIKKCSNLIYSLPNFKINNRKGKGNDLDYLHNSFVEIVLARLRGL